MAGYTTVHGVADAIPLILGTLRQTAIDERCHKSHDAETTYDALSGDTTVTVRCGDSIERAVFVRTAERVMSLQVVMAVADKIASKFHPWAYFERTSR